MSKTLDMSKNPTTKEQLEHIKSQTDMLAKCILDRCPGEIGKGNPQEGEGACDVAVRLIERMFPKGLLTFGLAIEALKQGKKITREGWNGKGLYLQAEEDIRFSSSDDLIVFLIQTKDDTEHYLGAWGCHQGDVLAKDWMIL